MISLGLAGLLVACNGSEDSLPPPHDVQATWRVRCEAPDEACDYPVRAIVGSIGLDDPDGFDVGCDAADGALDVTVGKVTSVTPNGTVPGFGLSIDVGYDPATGFDLSRCAVLLGEDDERQWGGSCGATAPSPGFPCQLDAPTLVDGALALSLRCDGLGSIPFQVGRDADLASGADPSTPIALQISGCDAEP
jgi:hypothetical protein